MRVKVLGCSGGIGAELRTTSLLVDDTILIDAGTGVGDLDMDALLRIDHVFLTHTHLDHIAMLPLLVDTVGAMRSSPITLWALPENIAILRQHIFNWLIWPDFTAIPSVAQPFLQMRPFACGDRMTIGDTVIRALPAVHTVPAVGYQLDSGEVSLVFTGDTTTNDVFWPVVNGIGNLKYLIIETAFCNRERDLALASKHLCPSMLADELEKLSGQPEIWITHLKPGEADLTMREIQADAGHFSPKMLANGQLFEC